MNMLALAEMCIQQQREKEMMLKTEKGKVSGARAKIGTGGDHQLRWKTRLWRESHRETECVKEEVGHQGLCRFTASEEYFY